MKDKKQNVRKIPARRRETGRKPDRNWGIGRIPARSQRKAGLRTCRKPF